MLAMVWCVTAVITLALDTIGPLSSTGSPITFMIRPRVSWPTGTMMGAPVSVHACIRKQCRGGTEGIMNDRSVRHQHLENDTESVGTSQVSHDMMRHSSSITPDMCGMVLQGLFSDADRTTPVFPDGQPRDPDPLNHRSQYDAA